MATHLTVEQRLEWLAVRIDELELWVAREWVELDGWTFDGGRLAAGALWPDRSGVHRLAHARVTPPWPDARLELDLGGEGLLTLEYDDDRQRFGLDGEHRGFPVRDAPFAIAVEAVARLPFGAPNREPRLAAARLIRVEGELERLPPPAAPGGGGRGRGGG